jgi:hypothetical protein
MDITTVQLTGTASYLVNGVASVPNDPANLDHQSVLSWIAEGNVPAAAPGPDSAQQARDAYATKLGAGIAITSTGTPALNATYALDQVTLDEVGALARDCAAGLGFPQGASTFAYPDIAGTPRTFTPPEMQALYRAMRDMVFLLNEAMATMAAGGSPSWPVQTAVIA